MLRVEEQQTFEGFSPEDFDAYSPEKWNSNMFTLPRRKVKGKLEFMGKELEEELKQAELSLVAHLSDEFPSLWNRKRVDSQWLFYSRDEDARREFTDIVDKERTLAETLADPTPRFRQVFLGVAVRHETLDVGLWIHHDAWVDRKNFLNLLADPADRERFIQVLAELPEHYEIGLLDRDATSPAEVSDSAVSDLAGRFDAQGGWFFVGARMPRDQVSVLEAEVVAAAREAFRCLVSVYKYIAWSPENDRISLDTLVEQRKEELKEAHEAFDRERAEREARKRLEESERLRLREEIEDRVRETQAWRQREIAARRAAARAAEAEQQENDARARAEAIAASWGAGKKGDEAEKAPQVEEPEEPKEIEEIKETKETKDAPPTQQRPDQGRSAGSQPWPGRDKDAREKRGRPRAESDRRAPRGKPNQGRGPLPARPEPVKVSAQRAALIRVGDVVEVRKGFLRGRRGTVQELDEKGGLRVNFGALSSRLALEDVAGLGPAVGPEAYKKDAKR